MMFLFLLQEMHCIFEKRLFLVFSTVDDVNVDFDLIYKHNLARMNMDNCVQDLYLIFFLIGRICSETKSNLIALVV